MEFYEHKIVAVEDLIPYALNSRTHSDEQVAQLAASIREFGFTNPVLIDQDANLIAGHGRLLAARKAKMDQVPAVVVTGLDDRKRRALVIADNKLALNAGWDEEALRVELEDLAGDFGELMGFSEEELVALLGGDVQEGLTDEDAVPDAPEQPVTVEGDVWILGRHRLMCGDSTSIDAVEKLMDGRKADVLFTDPPYGIDFAPQRGTHGKIMNDALEGADFDTFLDAVFAAALASMKPDTYAFVWTGWSKIGAFERSLQRLFKIQAMHIWVKNNFGIGYYSRPKHEPFYLCLNGKPVYPANPPADVWEAKKVHKTVHSCEKPVDLIVDILDTYHKNSTALDLFGGSGSTLIACEKTARDCRMMELDPKYCDVIIKRWQEFTGQEATHEASGETYAQLGAKQCKAD
ncbi:MAG: DNA methyltransferase [Flavobacteriaceae bacterium]|nr:DNA methyltransferase [Flavobacteriaceae bacterium]